MTPKPVPMDQAVSLARPLPRRAETMARPARVRIRRRKPWTRARRRLFGWNVRLPLATVNTPRVRWAPRDARSLLVKRMFDEIVQVIIGAIPGLAQTANSPHHTEGDCTRVLIAPEQVKLGMESVLASLSPLNSTHYPP
jgi:hypothetical protein